MNGRSVTLCIYMCVCVPTYVHVYWHLQLVTVGHSYNAGTISCSDMYSLVIGVLSVLVLQSCC